MAVRKKIIIGFSALFCLFLVWYLFIKETDYCVSFKVKAATGTVFQGIQEWSAIQLISEKRKFYHFRKEKF